MEANKPIEVFLPFFMHADLRSANLAMSSLLKRHDLNDDVECLSATLSYPGNGEVVVKYSSTGNSEDGCPKQLFVRLSRLNDSKEWKCNVLGFPFHTEHSENDWNLCKR